MNRAWIGKELFWIVFIAFFFLLSATFIEVGFCQKPPPKTSQILDKGKQIYREACFYCHGINGDGKGPLSSSLKSPPANFTKPFGQWKNTRGDPKKIFETIASGVPGTAMANFHYSEEERWALAYTVMAFSREK